MIAALALTVAAATIIGAIEWARMAATRARTRRDLAHLRATR